MQCKLLKHCYGFNRWIFLSFWALQVQAQLTVQPMNGGTISPSTIGGGAFYYFVNQGGGGIPQLPGFVLFTPLLLGASAQTDPGGGNAWTVQLTTVGQNLYNNVGTQQVVVTIQVSASSPRFAPIAFVNGQSCDGTYCQGQNFYAQNSGLFYAAKFSPSISSTITLGFYPQDICADASLTGQFVTGCTQGGISIPTSGQVTVLPLTFSVWIVSDGNLTTMPAANASAVDKVTSPVLFNFQIDTPQLQCPSLDILQNNYIPADQNIYLSPAGFSLNTCTLCAPGVSLVAVANEEAVPAVGANFNQRNAVVGTLQLTNDSFQKISGFQNSSATQDHPYQMSFLIQDQAGVYAPSSLNNTGEPTCLLDSVRSIMIDGYLRKNDCFIATAAFGDGESPPVQLLRKFRDVVLLNFEWGQRTVEWYYSWSPGAAKYVQQRDWLRLPVLFFLFPWEMLAWVALHFFE